MRSLAQHRHVAVVLDLVKRSVERAIHMEFVDRAVALASLTFTAMVPLGVVVGAVVPGIDQDGFAQSIVRRFELDRQTASIVENVFAAPGDVRGTVSVVGILLLVFSALSFTRAMQRVYERAWGLPSMGVRATPAGLTWLLGVVIFLSAFSGIRAAIVDTSRPVISVVAALVFSGAVWLFSPWILLSRRVSWRQLRATALLTATAMTCLSAASLLYMPRSIASSAESYGPIGVAISLVSWLVAMGFVLVVCAAVGAVLGERRSDDGQAALARSDSG